MSTIGLVVAFAGALLLIAGPYGVRAGWWPYLAGFVAMGLALLLALTAMGLLAAGARRAHVAVSVAGLAIALIVAAVPARLLWQARGTPPIHDISTDLVDPPRFERVLALRGATANAIVPPDAQRVRRQQEAYPDVQPLVLDVTTAEAFDLAEAAARALGWQIVDADRERGHLEATATTRWFGFADDVVVRIHEASEGTRLDVRSTSRVGIGDAGTNARRIRLFLERVRQGAP